MRKGFTLVELMLVVIILGILVGMVVPRLVGRSEEARIAAAKADINGSIATALDLYEMDMGSYPDNLNELCKEPTDTKKQKRWKGPYLKKCTSSEEGFTILDPWGNPYQYEPPSGEAKREIYHLWSWGPNQTDEQGEGDDITNWKEESKEK
ncbi:MAG: type II secretion system major pseudopilin GspG [Candidatus Omnitrophica bacterium]|nr:type II secretion system major pseudopilin GspG [Candidatus Omnitrophota bacterium]MCM8798950.1 type II secretion system major pseudopilin GspG [Candidatus Omnitrophota bacterium]